MENQQVPSEKKLRNKASSQHNAAMATKKIDKAIPLFRLHPHTTYDHSNDPIYMILAEASRGIVGKYQSHHG